MTPKPQRVLVVHGEKKKCEDLALAISRSLKIKALAPEVEETIKLR